MKQRTITVLGLFLMIFSNSFGIQDTISGKNKLLSKEFPIIDDVIVRKLLCDVVPLYLSKIETDDFSCEYTVIFQSDSTGNYYFEVKHIKGDMIHENFVTKVKGIKIYNKPKAEGFYVAVTSEYNITIKQYKRTIKKKGEDIKYKNEIADEKVRLKILENFEFRSNGKFKMKLSHLKVNQRDDTKLYIQRIVPENNAPNFYGDPMRFHMHRNFKIPY